MRNAFAQQLTQLSSDDERIVLLSGDIGNRLFNDFKSRYSERFFNCGVAEANMMSVAAGMAMNGLRPVVYTITPFVTTRCLEQIRVDVCYHNTPVVIVGVGSGLSYAGLGATHHSCEDIAMLRSLPNMTVICPGDPSEVALALQEALRAEGPVYLRIGKKGEPQVHAQPPAFAIGKGITLRQGSDVTLLATGTILPAAVEAGELLASRGVSPRIVSLHTVKPLDEPLLSEVFAQSTVVATIEEHSLIGGLGGAVAEWLSDHPQRDCSLLRIGAEDAFFCETGDQAYARRQLGLDASSIAEKILSVHSAAITDNTRP